MQEYAASTFTGDKRRREIIDGKIYLMASPNEKHVSIQYNLCSIFNNHFKKGKNKCLAILAKDLYISKKNSLIPDLLVYCKSNNEKKNKKIPLIVVEVLSGSTWKRDVTIKMEKYAGIGIEEYWIIDPETQRLTVYKLENNRYEQSSLYNLPVSEEKIEYLQPEEPEENEEDPETEETEDGDVIKEFSPAFFPDLTVSLEEIFDFENLDLL